MPKSDARLSQEKTTSSARSGKWANGANRSAENGGYVNPRWSVG